MLLNSRLWVYEARIVFGSNTLLGLLAMPSLACLGALIWNGGQPRAERDVLAAFEIGLPLVTAMTVAHVMTAERDAGFELLRRSYPETSATIPLLRTAGSLVTLLLITLIGVLAFRITFGPFALDHIVLPALPPTLYLMSLAMVVSNATGIFWAGAGSAMIYWLLESFTYGSLTGPLFLFNSTYPQETFDPALNHLLLSMGAFGWWTLNIMVQHWQRQVDR